MFVLGQDLGLGSVRFCESIGGCWDLRSRTSHIDIFIGCHLYIDICFIDKLSDALSSVCYGDVRMAMI